MYYKSDNFELNCTDTENFINALYQPAIADTKLELSKLYVGMNGGKGGTFADAFPEERWERLSSLKSYINNMYEFCKFLPHHLNYTVSVRNRPGAKAMYVDGVTCLWVDIDGKLYRTWKESSFHKINKFLPPSAVVNSGWGVHLYWFLDEYLRISDAPSLGFKINAANRFLAWLTKGDLQSSSLEHLLRAPGSFNCKASPAVKTDIYFNENSERPNEIIRHDFNSIYASFINTAKKSLTVQEKFLSDSKNILKDNEIKELETEIYRTRDIYIRLTEEKIPIKTIGKNNPLSREGKLYGDDTNMKAQFGIIGEIIQTESQNCPLLKAITEPPYIISYFGWISLINAVIRLTEYAEAVDIIKRISLPGNTSQNPTGEIVSVCERMRTSIDTNDFLPYNCSKIDDCARCESMRKGSCKSILPFLQKAIKAKERQNNLKDRTE